MEFKTRGQVPVARDRGGELERGRRTTATEGKKVRCEAPSWSEFEMAETEGPSLNPESIPLEIWFKIVLPLATQSESEEGVDGRVEKTGLMEERSSTAGGPSGMPLMCNVRSPVSELIQHESELPKNRDPIVALGLTCRHMKALLGGHLFFYRPSNFCGLDGRLANCSMRFLSALESAGDGKGEGEVCDGRELEGNFYTADAIEGRGAKSVARLHANILVECILALPNCKWNRLMVFDLHHLSLRLYVTSRVFLELPGPGSDRANASRRIQILSSLATYGLSVRDEGARKKVMQLHASLRRLATCHGERASPMVPVDEGGREIQEFLDQLRQHICFSGVKRRHEFTVENLVAMVAKVERVREIPMDYAGQVSRLRPSRKMIWRYVHPAGASMEVSATDRQIASFQETRRFELVLRVIGLCSPRLPQELDALWQMEFDMTAVSVFFELHLVTYLAPYLVIDASLSRFLHYFCALVGREMRAREPNKPRRARRGLDALRHPRSRAKSKAVDVSYACMSGLTNIIATAYMYQLLDPLVELMELGLVDPSRWRYWGIAKRLTAAFQSTFVVRPRNWALAGLLHDVCNALADGDPQIKAPHCHPFLAPAVFYRWTRHLRRVGLQPNCTVSCYGITEHALLDSQPFEPILRPASWPGNPSSCPFLDLEVTLIQHMIATSDFSQLGCLCMHVANLEVLVRCVVSANSHRRHPTDFSNKLDTVLEAVVATLPALPHRLASDNIEYSLIHSQSNNLSALRAWTLIFSTLVSQTTNSRCLEPIDDSPSRRRSFYSSLYHHMLKRLVAWRPFFRSEQLALLWWNSLIHHGIASLSKSTPALLLLAESAYHVGCVPLAISISNHLSLYFHSLHSSPPSHLSQPPLLKLSKQLLKHFLEHPSPSLVLWRIVLTDYPSLLLPALLYQRAQWLRQASPPRGSNALEIWKLSQFRTKVRRRYQRAVRSSLSIVDSLLDHELALILPRDLLLVITHFLASEAVRNDHWATAIQLLCKIDLILSRHSDSDGKLPLLPTPI